jgi:hypothetical protein
MKSWMPSSRTAPAPRDISVMLLKETPNPFVETARATTVFVEGRYIGIYYPVFSGKDADHPTNFRGFSRNGVTDILSSRTHLAEWLTSTVDLDSIFSGDTITRENLYESVLDAINRDRAI